MSINIDNIKIKSKPDFNRLLKVLKRDGKPDRVPFYELFSNIHEKVVGHIIKKKDCKDEQDYTYKMLAYYNLHLGYDFLEHHSPYSLPSAERDKGEGNISFAQGGASLVGNWEEYEKYPWPKYETFDWKKFERIKDYIPEGMKCIPLLPGGVEENVILNIMGYEKLCMALYEDPKLVKQIFDNVGALMVHLFEKYVSYDFVGAVIINDDLGFKTQTMLAPDTVREYIFPWYRKLVKVAHDAGRPVILHSCGNLKEIYEDIIDVGIDAKHSYENVILPVWEFRKIYGNRIASLGGFDVDKICRDSKEEIIKHTRFLIDNCAGNGGYAIGTGNSVASYVNVENFLTMLEEAYLYGSK